MRKRIALIILIALYLVVPAVIKKLPIYEPVPIERHDTFYFLGVKKAVKNFVSEKYYELFKDTITFSIEGEEFTANLTEVSNGVAYYEGRKENRKFEYSFYLKNKDWFSFLIWDEIAGNNDYAGVEIPNYKSQIETGNEILSRYISLDRYNKIGDNPFWFGSGPEYKLYIGGYPTVEKISIGFFNEKLTYIDTMGHGYFSDYEVKMDIDDAKLLQIIKNTAYQDYGENIKLFNLEKKDSEHYTVNKTPRGELFISCEVSYDHKDGLLMVYIYLFPRTAWIISKYVLGISATLMFTWVLVSEIKTHRRKKSVPPQTEQETEEEVE